MAFDWMQVSGVSAQRPDAHVEMFRAEVIERARMLQRLGFSHAAAAGRIGAAVRWEYLEPRFKGAAPSVVDEVDGLVARVFDKT